MTSTQCPTCGKLRIHGKDCPNCERIHAHGSGATPISHSDDIVNPADDVALCRRCNGMNHLNEYGLCGRCMNEPEAPAPQAVTEHTGKLYTVNGTDEVQFFDGTKLKVNPAPQAEEAKLQEVVRSIIFRLGTDIKDLREAYDGGSVNHELINEFVAGILAACDEYLVAELEGLKSHGKTPMPDPPPGLGQDTEWWEKGYGAAWVDLYGEIDARIAQLREGGEVMEPIKTNNHKNYFSESGDVKLVFNLLDWLENERENGWDSELFTGLAQYAVEFIVKEAKGSYYSRNFNTNDGTLARMVLDEARKQDALPELADNHIKRLQGLLDKTEEDERRHERAMHEITKRLYDIDVDWVQDLRSQIISKYYTDTPFRDAPTKPETGGDDE